MARARAGHCVALHASCWQPFYGRNTFSFKSLIGLKCFALPEQRGMLFSVAVAAMSASPAHRP